MKHLKGNSPYEELQVVVVGLVEAVDYLEKEVISLRGEIIKLQESQRPEKYNEVDGRQYPVDTYEEELRMATDFNKRLNEAHKE